MAAVAEDIVAEGAEIIWVLEADQTVTPGTAESCMDVMDVLGDPAVGWCVGDGETEPVAGTFDDSPFSLYRGFDMFVPRTTMEIAFSSSHGSPAGNENLTGEELLEELRALIAALP